MQQNKQEISPIKQRIIEYLDSKGVTRYEFYKKSGVARGILDQNTGISEDNIARFIAYTENKVNLDWLLTGRGNMMIGTYRPKQNVSVVGEPDPINRSESGAELAFVLKKLAETQEDVIRMQNKQINTLMADLEQAKKELRELRGRVAPT
jgi:hypothetical protein